MHQVRDSLLQSQQQAAELQQSLVRKEEMEPLLPPSWQTPAKQPPRLDLRAALLGMSADVIGARAELATVSA